MPYIAGLIIIAVIIGCGEIFKNFGIKRKLLPVIDIALGIFGVFIYASKDAMPWYRPIMYGTELGVLGIGIYSGIKNTVELIKTAVASRTSKK